MIVIRRRLFWKVYLTLLSSLITVAVLIGGFWWLVGEAPRDPWGSFRLHLTDPATAGQESVPGAIATSLTQLGHELDADISIYGKDGILNASHGKTIALPLEEGDTSNHTGPGPGRVIRVDLPDGRIVLTRLRPPPRDAGRRILTIVLIVVGGVGLAAFPMTARLTRQLERLRGGVARWGAGSLSTRLDDTGSDEVAQVARTFNSAAERVEALLLSQRVLLANASHELRSPLARLRVANEILLDQPTADTQAEILRNLMEIDQLVDEILLASRLDHAGSTLVLKDIVDLLGLVAEEAVRADATFAGTRLEIRGDTTLLRRLIRNLLENAAKHGRPPVHVAVTRHKDFARIIVSDHGQGIAAEDRERIFEPFYRPAGRSEIQGGWGLGLSLVRQIAIGHGGNVACEAEAGGGSRFVVKLALGQASNEGRRLAGAGLVHSS